MYYRKLIFEIIFLFPTLLFAQNFLFDHLTVKDGLSESNVHAIYQDELNIMWIATADGINRYDGYKIETFRPIIGDTTGLFGNNIEKVYGNQDGEIYLKCWTGLIVYDTRSEKFQTIEREGVDCITYGNNRLLVIHQKKIKYLHNETKELIDICGIDPSLRVTCLFETSGGVLLLGTQFNGLLSIEPNGKTSSVISNGEIQCIYEDKHKRIWVGTVSDGLYCIDNQQNITSYRHEEKNFHSLSNNFVRCICQDDLGYLWIGTFDGLNRLYPDTKEFVHFRYSATNNYSIGASSVWCITKDNQGSLWIGTYFGGVDFIHPELTFEQYYHPTGEENEISGAIVSNVVEDSKGNLWICTDGAGLNFFDKKTKYFTHYKREEGNVHSLGSNTLKALYLDEKSGYLWIGSHLGGLSRMDLNTRQITRINLSTSDPRINNYVRCIVPFERKLLLGTHNSIQLFDPENHSIEPFIDLNEPDIRRQIWNMMIDSRNNLWFSTQSSVYRYSIKEKKLKRYMQELDLNEQDKLISQVCFFEDSQHRIWLGSRGKGLKLYMPETDSFHSFHTQNSGIIDDYILDINESPLGYLLIASNKGVSRLDVDNQVFYNYYNSSFFPFQALNERCLFITQKGEIGLGSHNGLLLITEREMNLKAKSCHINLTDLYVNNRRITPNNEPEILNKSIFYADTIWLNHNHSVITFEFASSNYIKALQPDIQYKLEGFDHDWIDAKRNNNSTYTNLNAGTYQFKVRGIDTSSKKNLQERVLTIIITPPFYQTWYAYVIYILILCGLFYLIFSRIKLAASLKYAYDENKYIEELNQSKLRFFMNISHEIRTPITLIISQLEILIQSNEISQSMHNKLSNIMRNAGKLKNLITELLDFRKHEQGLMTLRASEQDIIKYAEDIFLSFKEHALYRQINTSFIHNETEINVWFDKSQLNKVFYNLLSNAFKFTPAKGAVSLIIEKHPKCVTVSITDTGIGIKKEEIENLFERFYQSNHTGVAVDTGTGIGLALTKSIIELHKGTITVLNNETKGATFSFSLPLGNMHLTPNEICQSDIDQCTVNSLSIPEHEFVEEIKKNQEEISLKDASILIIEDNPDLLEMLAEIFSPIYKVYTAMNGVDGLEQAMALHPDIILSDIIMPEMSGIDLCKRIKANLEICHIPVVLLTASSSEEKELEGLQIGADDYITKPFNTKMLIMRCNNLVNNRIILQNKYKSSHKINTEQLALNQYDQVLLNKAIQIVEKNFGNQNFDLNVLAQEMCMGRSTLFKKVKGLTGQTPKDFIVNIRLKKGLELLKENPNLAITDIALMVGFNDASYFIRLFKQNFGMTPHQYRIKKNEVDLEQKTVE